jgi:heavy metal sensor kinase
MKSLPIRIRLTLWYFLMFASAAALLCMTSLWMLQRSVDDTEYHELQERADDVRDILSHEDEAQNIDQLRSHFASIYNFKDDGKYLQVRDEHGNWIFRSPRMIAQNPDLPAPAQLPNAGRVLEFRQGMHYVRTLAYPIVVRGKRYSVQTGLTLDRSTVLLATFRTNLLLLMPIVILLAATGGHLISRKALKPVAVLAAEARRINDRNLDIRLPVSSADDEIADLSRTLNQMLERIDKAFASVRTFTGNASHELRTPISLMRAEIEVALFRSRDAEEYRAVLGRLHEETIRMTNLVESLLALARADAGAETITLAPIRVDLLFDQTGKIWSDAMNLAQLDFHIEMPEHGLSVLGDALSLQRLLSILLENASKYTPPGGSVKLRSSIEGTRIVFFVFDTGPGIAPEYMFKIFDRFYRVPTGGTVPAGSGLGLSLAKWIAERHGSQLSVESAPGRGSTFSFWLQRTDIDLKTAGALEVPQAGSNAVLELPLI